MQSGAYMDLAQVTLYVFWIFFAGLIFYLRREDKREGYPLDSTALAAASVHGFPRMPEPKNYLLRGGHVATLAEPQERSPRCRGGADRSMAGRADGADRQSDARRRRARLLRRPRGRSRTHHRRHTLHRSVAAGRGYLLSKPRDPDPRGMRVIGADSEIGGVVTDVWVDRAEALIRYLEVEVTSTRWSQARTAAVAVRHDRSLSPPGLGQRHSRQPVRRRAGAPEASIR